MCVGALDHERRWAESALSGRLRFEELLSRMSGAFVRLPSHEMEGAFAQWLTRLASFFGPGHVFGALYDCSSNAIPLATSDDHSGGSLSRLNLKDEFPHALERLQTERVVILQASDTVKKEPLEHDRASLDRRRLESLVLVSMTTGDQHLGVLALMTTK